MNESPISYIPNAISDPDGWLERLTQNLPWFRRNVKLYGKTHPVPRDEVWIGEKPYKYSGHTYPAAPWPEILLPLKAIAEAVTGITYNSVLLNLYRDGRDKVAWHCDCEDDMSACHPICSMSLGATRKFQYRLRSPKDSPITTVPLESGSICLMSAGMQQNWYHQVPSEPKVTKPRINLTFRVMSK